MLSLLIVLHRPKNRYLYTDSKGLCKIAARSFSMNKEERLERSKRLIASMDAMTFQERAERFALAVTREKGRTYEGLSPGVA